MLLWCEMMLALMHVFMDQRVSADEASISCPVHVLMDPGFTAEARDRQGKKSCPSGNRMKGPRLALT